MNAGKKLRMFGSEAELVLLDAEGPFADDLIGEAQVLGLRLQKIFNIYDPESEISLLNKNRRMVASEELLSLVKRALEFCRLSGGEYDISKGKEFLARKKGKSMQVSCSYKDISLSGKGEKDGKEREIILNSKDAWIDLGSIAKGYIGERMAKFMQENGAESGYVDARGELRFFGAEQRVGVKHPRKEGLICTIRVKDAGVATSGDYHQFIRSYDESHVVNKKEIISATVVADDLALADAFASLIMVCAREKRDALMKSNPAVKALAIDEDLNMNYYNGFEKLIV